MAGPAASSSRRAGGFQNSPDAHRAGGSFVQCDACGATGNVEPGSPHGHDFTLPVRFRNAKPHQFPCGGRLVGFNPGNDETRPTTAGSIATVLSSTTTPTGSTTERMIGGRLPHN